jgi:hypothetical protein
MPYTTIFLLSLMLASAVSANTALLRWTNPTTKIDGTPLTDLAGITVHYGPASRTYTMNFPVGVTESASVSGLPSGTTYFAVSAYRANLVQSAYSTERSVTFRPGPAPPTVIITAPRQGAIVTRKPGKNPPVVTMKAEATEGDKAIARVEFSINGVVRCTDRSAPYTCRWKVPLKRGHYRLSATAWDTADHEAVSPVITVESR